MLENRKQHPENPLPERETKELAGGFMNKLKLMLLAFFITISFACASSPQPASPETIYQKRIDHYSRIIHINPENVQAYKKRAENYYYLERYEEALSDLTIALNLDPKNSVLQTRRSEIHLLLDHYEEALDDADNALKIDGENMYARNNRGSAYVFLGQYDKALADFNICIDSDPENAVYRINRADLYWELQRYEEAIEDCTRVIELNPIPLYAKIAYTGRGDIYSRLSERTEDKNLKEMYKQKADADHAAAEKYE